MEKTKILFVCLGNICRSPLAEAIFKNKISQKGLTHLFEADSCGTGNYHIGSQPDHRTIANAGLNNVPIDHCARQLTTKDLETFDLVLAMDSNNLNNILKLPNAYKYSEKIKMVRQYNTYEDRAEVPDPYFGGEEGFQEVFEILDRTLDNLIDYLIAKRKAD